MDLKYILNTIFLFLALSIHGQTILPSNTTPVGALVAPVGWTILIGTTDVSDRFRHAGITDWYGVVDNPPNGHLVWVSGVGFEQVGTTISGLEIGLDYTFSFCMAELGFGPDPVDGVLEVTVGDEPFLFPFTGGVDNSWTVNSVTFTATDETILLTFNFEIPTYSYWNVSIGEFIYEACDSLETEVSSTDICIGDEVILSATSLNDGTVT